MIVEGNPRFVAILSTFKKTSKILSPSLLTTVRDIAAIFYYKDSMDLFPSAYTNRLI